MPKKSNGLSASLKDLEKLAQIDVDNKKDNKSFTEANDLTLDEETDLQNNSNPSTYLQKYVEYSEAIDNEKTRKRNGKILKWKIRNNKQDVKMRRRYASKAYNFVFLWSCFLFITIILSGYKDIKISSPNLNITSKFELNDSVLIALISGVTVNIVAVFVIVIRNLFPNAKSDGDNSSTNEKNTKPTPEEKKPSTD